MIHSAPPSTFAGWSLLALLLLGLAPVVYGPQPALQPASCAGLCLVWRLAVTALLVLILAQSGGQARQRRRAQAGDRRGPRRHVQSMSLGEPSRLEHRVGNWLLAALGPTLDGVPLAHLLGRDRHRSHRRRRLSAPPTGRRTCLGAAVARGVALAHSSGVRNLVVISDGRADDPAALADAGSLAAAQGIAVSVVPVGEPPKRTQPGPGQLPG